VRVGRVVAVTVAGGAVGVRFGGGVIVAVSVGTSVAVSVGMNVAVSVGTSVAVAVGMNVTVSVGMTVAVATCVALAAGSGARVAAPVALGAGMRVACGTCVADGMDGDLWGTCAITGGTEVESGVDRAVAPIGEDTGGIRQPGGAAAVPKRYQITTPIGAAHSSDTQIGQLAFPLLFPMPGMVPSRSAHFMVLNHSVRHRPTLPRRFGGRSATDVTMYDSLTRGAFAYPHGR
jgi:hypothetical protein